MTAIDERDKPAPRTTSRAAASPCEAMPIIVAQLLLALQVDKQGVCG